MKPLKGIIEDVTSSASDIIRALRSELPDVITWEPESIFEELQDEGIVTSEQVQDKILAGLTLLISDDFYLSPSVFENTVNAFGNRRVDISIMQEPYVPHMAWAVEEAGRVRKLGNRTLSYPSEDVCRYIAIVLHLAGFVLAPSQLECAQEWLDDLNSNTKLKVAVRPKWNEIKDLDEDSLASKSFNEETIDVQLSRLTEVEVYVRFRRGQN